MECLCGEIMRERGELIKDDNQSAVIESIHQSIQPNPRTGDGFRDVIHSSANHRSKRDGASQSQSRICVNQSTAVSVMTHAPTGQFMIHMSLTTWARVSRLSNSSDNNRRIAGSMCVE